MKIRTIIFAFLALLPLVGFSQALVEWNFAGKVRKVVYNGYLFDSVCKPHWDSDTTRFYSYKGIFTTEVKTRSGNSLREESFNDISRGELYSHTVSLYDSLYGNMRPRSVITKHPDGSTSVTTEYKYVFDTTENKLYAYQYKSGKLARMDVTTFDNIALPVKAVIYYFGEKDTITEHLGYDKSILSKIGSSYHYVYGNSLNLLQTIEYKYYKEGVCEKNVWFFDSDGNVIKIAKYDPDDELMNELVMKYDKHGNLTKRVITYYNLDEVEKHTDEYKYKYDKHGNWVEKRFFVNGECYMTSSRSIEYEE